MASLLARLAPLLALSAVLASMPACAASVGEDGDEDGSDEATGVTEDELSDGKQHRTLKVMTLNLRHDTDQWKRRFPLVADEIDRLDPDFVGVQEIADWKDQIDELNDLVQKRGHARYHAYTKRKTAWLWFKGEAVGILSRWKLEGTEWTDLEHYRPGVKATVRIDDGLVVDVYNTHLHHEGGDDVRLPQAERMTRFVASNDEGRLTFLTGDMNATDGTRAIRHFRSAGFVDSFAAANPVRTNEVGATSPVRLADGAFQQAPKNRIDYVFAKAGRGVTAKPVKSEVVLKNHDAKGFYPSDHLAVMTTFDVAY